MTPFTWAPGAYEGITAGQYHRDELGPVPTLSRGAATAIENASLKECHYRHPRLGGHPKEVSDQAEFAGLIHALLLDEDEPSGYQILEYKDFKTNAARDDRDAARAAGLVPMVAAKRDEAAALAGELRPGIEHWIGQPLASLPKELTVLHEEEVAGRAPVRCRHRLDIWMPQCQSPVPDLNGFSVIGDIKISNQSIEAYVRDMWRHGNDIQGASYVRAVEHIFPKLAGRARFVALLCPEEAPWDVVPCIYGTKLNIGESKWLRSVSRWADGLDSGAWPGRSPGRADASSWEIQRELELTIGGVE
jgi:hypothetical protein